MLSAAWTPISESSSMRPAEAWTLNRPRYSLRTGANGCYVDHAASGAARTLTFAERLLLPRCESIGEGALARRAFFHGEDGAAVIVVDDGYVEPAALLEQLQVALLVGKGAGKADQIKAVADLHREPGERHAARRL